MQLPGWCSEDAAHELLRPGAGADGRDAERDDVPERNTLGRVADQFRTYYKIDEEDALFRALRTIRGWARTPPGCSAATWRSAPGPARRAEAARPLAETHARRRA